MAPPRRPAARRFLGLSLVIAAIPAACAREAEPPGTAARGAQVFRSLCVACHHPDPKLSYGETGTQGPALFGSSLELLRARVRSNDYPLGYQPKRATGLMPKFDLPDTDLVALHKFLNADGG